MKKFIFLLFVFSIIFSLNFVWSQEQVKQDSSNFKITPVNSIKRIKANKQFKVIKPVYDFEEKMPASQLMFSLKLNGESFQNGVVESFDGTNLVVNSNGFKMTWYVATDTQVSNLTIKKKSRPRRVDTEDKSTARTTGETQNLGTLGGPSYKTATSVSTTTIVINTQVKVHGRWNGSKLVAKKIILVQPKPVVPVQPTPTTTLQYIMIPGHQLYKSQPTSTPTTTQSTSTTTQ